MRRIVRAPSPRVPPVAPAECIAKRVHPPTHDPPTRVKDQQRPTAAESRVCAKHLRLAAAVGCC